jgi:ribonuclease R
MDMALSHDIIKICRESAPAGASVEDCAEALHVSGPGLLELFDTFDELVRSGLIMRSEEDRYVPSPKDSVVTGIYKGYTSSFGFVLCENLTDDVYISEQYRHTAMNNDKVEVHILQSGNGRHKQEGEIVRILERANETLVGTFDRLQDCGFVTPDDERIREDIYIPLSKSLNARSSARVLVKITEWPEENMKAEGEITEILGYDGDKDLDIRVIMARHNLPFSFPVEVAAAAEAIDKTVSMEPGRRDYRQRQLITIDSEDAKDLDDAVDVIRLANGNFQLGVYIADVSRYVRPQSKLDDEAFKRGTSVYLVDRVIPMLPEALSNGICSLNAGEDRYAMTCVMEIDPQGKVVHADIGPAVICVKRRCNYREITKALQDGIVPDDLQSFMPMLKDLRELAGILRSMRMRRGAIDFDFPEYKIILNQDGKPLRLEKRERTISEQMIEESMLIANETVASYLRDSENPTVYRIHETPEPEKVAMLRTVLNGFNLPIPSGDDIKPVDFQRLLSQTKGTEAQLVVETVTLRTMQQAKYSTIDTGHFGLASECYTHFTSPIRRYPDLMVHRLIRNFQQKGKLSDKEAEKSLAWHTIAAEQASQRERVAVEAERETDDLKKTEYMAPFIGEAFEAHVSGITPFGLFVSLDNGIEGLVHVSLFTDDIYEFDESRYVMAGLHGGKVFRLGDAMTVTLAKVNIEKCELDFVPGKVESLADLQHMMDARAERRSGHQSNNKDKTGRTGMSIHQAGHKNVKSMTAKKGKKTRKGKKSGKKTGKRK